MLLKKTNDDENVLKVNQSVDNNNNNNVYLYSTSSKYIKSLLD